MKVLALFLWVPYQAFVCFPSPLSLSPTCSSSHSFFSGVQKLDIIVASSRSFTGAASHTLHSLSAVRQSVKSKVD